MLAESTWTKYTETKTQIGMDVPDYMPEGRPGIIVAMQSMSRMEGKFCVLMTSMTLA